LLGIQPLPCSPTKLQDCSVVEDSPQVQARELADPEGWKIVPLSKLPPRKFLINVVAVFDGTSGLLSDQQRIIVSSVDGLTSEQQEEMEGVVGGFLRGCRFVFVKKQTANSQYLVELSIDLTIDVR
jgi:hypothetical protein